jgi:DNA-binding NtrC family response regulator
VLIEGETGTGKSEIAELVHNPAGPGTWNFETALLTEEASHMVAPMLFGNCEGYATDVRARQGKIAAAGEGTLFLDEIGELSLENQTRLLRPIRAREYEVLGTNEPLPVKCRFVFATNRNLAREVEAGRFRLDVFHRINGLRLVVPPLRERREDIPFLIEHMLEKLETKTKEHDPLPRPSDLNAPDVMEHLNTHPWEGNVGQLYNTVLLAAALGSFREALNIAAKAM